MQVRTLVCCAVLSFGQSKPPAFEVASVKPHQGPLTRIADFRASGPRLSMEGYNAKLLILEAYGLKNYQVSFASPSPWVDDFYDIEAKAEGDGLPTRAEFREMIQTLLADRFKIKIHREMREMPVYELTLPHCVPYRLSLLTPDEFGRRFVDHFLSLRGRDSSLPVSASGPIVKLKP